MTPDMWHATHGDTAPLLQRYEIYDVLEDWEEKDDWLTEWINQSISYKAVCRTAPATPGLLIIQIITLFTPASASTDLTAFPLLFDLLR